MPATPVDTGDNRFGLPVWDLRVDCVYERTALTHHLDDGTRITIIQKVRGHARRGHAIPPPHCHWIR